MRMDFFGAFDEDGTPASAAGADRAVGGGRRGEPGDRPSGWMYNRYGVEVAGALRREAVCGCPWRVRKSSQKRIGRGALVSRSSSDGSKRRPCFRLQTPPPCCSGRCSIPGRSTCARSMVGTRSQQRPSISQLTSLPDSVLSKCRRTRHPHSNTSRDGTLIISTSLSPTTFPTLPIRM